MQSNQTSVRLKCLLLTMLTFAVALGFVQQAHAYTFTILNIGAQAFTQANGINESDEVVGTFIGVKGLFEGFRRDTKGAISEFSVPNASATSANGINNSGQIVGFFVDASGHTRGFLRHTNGTFTTIDVPGAIQTQAFGINALGEIVGTFKDGSGFHGFKRDTKGDFAAINGPGGFGNTEVHGINDSGEIAGSFTTQTDGQRGFLLKPNGELTPFKVPGLPTDAWGINNSGQIVGFITVTAIGPPFITQGFRRDKNGTVTFIPNAGGLINILQGLGINASGKIVGPYTISTGFLATP
jgi:probable HAF family extracellular repeat protein